VAPGPVSYRRWYGPRVVAHRDYYGWRR
jgi:hypothetical protein